MMRSAVGSGNGQETRLDVPVRADEREVARLLVEGARDAADRGLGVEVAVLVEGDLSVPVQFSADVSSRSRVVQHLVSGERGADIVPWVNNTARAVPGCM